MIMVKKQRVYHVSSDLMDGLETIYYPTGKKNLIRKWKKGHLHGTSINYYENGSKYIVCRYKQGQKHGGYRVYNRIGLLMARYRYPLKTQSGE